MVRRVGRPQCPILGFCRRLSSNQNWRPKEFCSLGNPKRAFETQRSHRWLHPQPNGALCDSQPAVAILSRSGRILKHKGHKESRRTHEASHFLTRAPSDLEGTQGFAMSQNPTFVASLWVFVSFVFQNEGDDGTATLSNLEAIPHAPDIVDVSGSERTLLEGLSQR